MSAASDYYRARISVEELRLKAAMPNGEWKQEANKENQDAQMQALRNRVDAAIEAAKAMATEVAAALNALHVSSSTSGSGGTSVNYSYRGEVSSSVSPKTTA
jgi:phage-related baseplate assembly protein